MTMDDYAGESVSADLLAIRETTSRFRPVTRLSGLQADGPGRDPAPVAMTLEAVILRRQL